MLCNLNLDTQKPEFHSTSREWYMYTLGWFPQLWIQKEIWSFPRYSFWFLVQVSWLFKYAFPLYQKPALLIRTIYYAAAFCTSFQMVFKSSHAESALRKSYTFRTSPGIWRIGGLFLALLGNARDLIWVFCMPGRCCTTKSAILGVLWIGTSSLHQFGRVSNVLKRTFVPPQGKATLVPKRCTSTWRPIPASAMRTRS